jgi:hypothetical protein
VSRLRRRNLDCKMIYHILNYPYAATTNPPPTLLHVCRTSICAGTGFPLDQEPALQLDTHSCHRAFVPHPSACCLHLLSRYPYVHALVRCWDPSDRFICYNTDFQLDPEPARQLHPNQLAVLDCCPFTRTSFDTGIQSILPPAPTLLQRRGGSRVRKNKSRR